MSNTQTTTPMNGQNQNRPNQYPILNLEVFGLKIEITSQNGKPNEEMIQLLISVLEGNISALKEFLSYPSASAEAPQQRPSFQKYQPFLEDYDTEKTLCKRFHHWKNLGSKY